MKSKAMVMENFFQPLEMQEFDIPPLAQGQVLVKLDAAGVCGSDVHMWKGEDPRTPLPIILGHEGVGTIADMKGPRQALNGGSLAIGDSILWNRGISCHKCFYCNVLNEPSLCENRQVYGINIPAGQPPYLNGCYSEYIILSPDTDIFLIPQDVDPAILVTASCSGATMAHGFDMVKSSMGDKVLVQGPGPLGAYACAFARKMGATEIIVIGGSHQRLELCQEFGATVTLNRRETTVEERRERILELTQGRGVDLVVEAAGAQGAVEEGIQTLRMGGTYMTTGYSQPAGVEKLDFFLDVVRKNVNIQGVWVSDTRHTFQALELVLSEQEIFSKMITHRYQLAEANEAVQVMDSKEALKAVLTF